MIQYTLISSILDRICEMKKKPLEYPRDDTQPIPLQHLPKIRTWGTKWKSAIVKIDKQAAWRWANGKREKESLALLKQTINICKEDMEYYNWAMFTHAMDFFKKHAN